MTGRALLTKSRQQLHRRSEMVVQMVFHIIRVFFLSVLPVFNKTWMGDVWPAGWKTPRLARNWRRWLTLVHECSRYIMFFFLHKRLPSYDRRLWYWYGCVPAKPRGLEEGGAGPSQSAACYRDELPPDSANFCCCCVSWTGMIAWCTRFFIPKVSRSNRWCTCKCIRSIHRSRAQARTKAYPQMCCAAILWTESSNTRKSTTTTVERSLAVAPVALLWWWPAVFPCGYTTSGKKSPSLRDCRPRYKTDNALGYAGVHGVCHAFAQLNLSLLGAKWNVFVGKSAFTKSNPRRLLTFRTEQTPGAAIPNNPTEQQLPAQQNIHAICTILHALLANKSCSSYRCVYSMRACDVLVFPLSRMFGGSRYTVGSSR